MWKRAVCKLWWHRVKSGGGSAGMMMVAVANKVLIQYNCNRYRDLSGGVYQWRQWSHMSHQ